MPPSKSHRLAYVVTHPIQYQAPLLRRLAQEPDIQLKVFFLSDFSLHEHHEKEFGQTFKWDLSLVDGYEWEVVERLGNIHSHELQSWWPVDNFRSKLQEGKFDAVWVHGWGHIGLLQAIWAADSCQIPVFLRGESLPNEFPATVWSLKGAIRRIFLQCVLERISACLSIGSLNRRFYESLGVPAERIFHVPYAVDNQRFTSECAIANGTRDRLRSELGLEQGRPVILFAAKFIPVKNPLLLIAAFKEAWSLWPDPKPYLLLVGDGPLRDSMRRMAGTEYHASIRFAGFRNQSEMAVYYNLCDLFILPSQFEPWGLVINEAMNAARPVIASDAVGAARDLIEDGVNGWIFQSEEPDDLVRVLAGIPHSDLRRMGEQSYLKISAWGFEQDVLGIKAALRSVHP